MNDKQKEFKEKLRQIYKTQDKIEPLVEGMQGIPQKTMKDFYIKLHTTIDENDEKSQNTSEKLSSKKQEIELESIFDKLSGEEENSQTSGAVNRLLILGGAGVGKSTMMKYITYKWGEGELWKDIFDYVYRVPLKILLGDDWKSGYTGDVMDLYPLKCLVHYYLKSLLETRQEKVNFKLENVVWNDGKNNKMNERILLLLDGYDEVASFQGRFKDLFEDVFGFENIILTSRPNALNQEMTKKFDRKIENTGLGNEGITQYFNRYFEANKEKGKEFQKFLARNPSIKEICNIPVNIAMLCFIWSEKSVEDLEKISGMSDLYGQVVNHLGVRFLAKHQAPSMQDSGKLEAWRGEEVWIDELAVLQHVAFQSLIGGELEDPNGKRSESRIIKGKITRDDEDGISIQSSILYLKGKLQDKRLTVSRVCEYGLLKCERGSDSSSKDLSDPELQNKSFSFLHLSFQEYLTAQYLVERLREGTQEEQARIANFIARHRNEPRLALILKFMAGILRAAFEGYQKEEIIRAIKIFWDAVLCNPNGALELGTDAKVNLFMHLFGQVKQKEIIDSRIPNQELAVKFIDCRVLENILWWVDELKDSDYMSENIKEGLLKILLDGDSNCSRDKSGEIFKELSLKLQRTSLDEAKEVIIPEQEKSSEEVLSLSKISIGEQKLIQEEISGAISSLILKFTPEEQSQIVQKLLSDIKKDRTDEQQFAVIKKKMNAMIKIAQTITLSLQDSQTFIETLLENIFYKNLGLASRRAIIEILKITDEPQALKKMIKEHLRKIHIDPHCKVLQAHLKGIIDLARVAGSDDIDFIREIVHIIIPLFENSGAKGRERAAETLTGLVEECSGDLGSQILQDLLSILILTLSKDKKAIIVSAANTIISLVNCKVMKANSQLVLDFAQDHIIPLLGEQISKKYYQVLDVAEALLLPLFELNKEKVQEIAYLLIPKLSSPNPLQITEISKRLEIIAKAYGTTNIPLIRDLIEGLTPALKEPNPEARLYALESMTRIAENVKDRGLCHDVVKAFPDLLLDAKKEIQGKTLESILKLLQISPSNNIDLFKEMMGNLIKSFSNFDPSIRSASSKSLKNLVMKSGIPDVKWLKDVIDTLALLTEEESINVNKREIAFDTILDLAMIPVPGAKNGELVKELIETFNSKMEKASPELKARMTVMVVRLERIIGNKDLQIVRDAFDGLSDLLENDDDHVSLTAAKNMLELLRILVVTDDVQLMKTSIARFCVVLELQEKNQDLQAAIVFYITELFKITGDKYIEFIDELIPVLVPHVQVQKKTTLETGKIHQVALLGVVRLFKASNCRNIQITQDLIQGLIRNKALLIESKKLVSSVQDVIKVYGGSQDVLNQLLIPRVKSRSIGKIVSEEILAIVVANDSQNIQNLLNEELLGDSVTPQGKAQIFKLKLDLLIKEGDLSTEKIEPFISTLKPFLHSDDFNIKQNAFAYLTETMKISGYQDPELIRDLVSALNYVLSAAVKEKPLEPPVPNNILNLLEITENKDKELIRKVLLFFIENPQSENSEGKRESCCWVLKILKKETDKEFLKRVLEDVIPKLDLKQHAGLVQKLSVFLLPHIEIIEKYLDHPTNLNMRKNFRAGVMHYFKIYLNKFEVLEELIKESSTKELTLKEINEKLFDKIVDEDGCCSKRQSNLSEVQLNNDKEALRSILAKEIDRAEARQGIEIVQLAFLAIAKVEYSKYQVEKKLPELAWEVIRVIHKYLKKEKLAWVSNNYERLRDSASNAAAIKAIFAKLYHKILEDGVITPEEEKLITLFIQQGLTTSLTKKGEIVFQDIKYEIKGYDMRFMLEKIARMIIGMDQDLLAKQYKTNTPIFEKSWKNGGIQEASVDQRKIVSVVDRRFVLRNDFWVLTSLRPVGVGSEIVLLEQRSAFGDHVVYKLQEEGFKELQENFSLEDVFGEYEPDLFFTGKSKILSSQRGQKLVKEIWTQVEDIEGSQEEIVDLYFHEELLGKGKYDRMMRTLASKQDNPICALKNQLELLRDLKPSEKAALYEYHEGFISTCNSLYIVSIAVESGTLAVAAHEESKFSPTSMFKTMVALIPVVGEKISEGIEKLAKRVKDNEFQNNAVFMKAFAGDVVDLSDQVSKIAREKLAKPAKRIEILQAKEKDPSGKLGKIAEIQEMVLSMINKLKLKALEITKINNLFKKEIEKSPAFRLGEKDANEMIQEWFEFNHSPEAKDLKHEERREKFTDSKTKKGNATLKGTNEARPAACFSCQIF